MTARFHTNGNRDPKRQPRIWLRIDKAHVAKVIKARRELGYGEGVRR